MFPVYSLDSHSHYQDFSISYFLKYHPDPFSISKQTWKVIIPFWHMEDGRHRSSMMWYCRLYCTMMPQHLDAWEMPFFEAFPVIIKSYKPVLYFVHIFLSYVPKHFAFLNDFSSYSLLFFLNCQEEGN